MIIVHNYLVGVYSINITYREMHSTSIEPHNN